MEAQVRVSVIGTSGRRRWSGSTASSMDALDAGHMRDRIAQSGERPGRPAPRRVPPYARPASSSMRRSRRPVIFTRCR